MLDSAQAEGYSAFAAFVALARCAFGVQLGASEPPDVEGCAEADGRPAKNC